LNMYSRKEAAEILGISLRTLDQLRKDRKIGFYQAREGHKVQFTQAHIDKYLKGLDHQPKEIKIKNRL